MVYVDRRIRRGWQGRFKGFRLNCESVPMLPAWIVREVWEDPRRIPYLLIWKGHFDGQVKEAVRLARTVPKTNFPEADSIEVKRTDGSVVPVYLAWRWQPHGGRTLLLKCWQCQTPCRALYGFKVGDDGRFYKAVLADWQCRSCAELSYSSEDGHLRPTGLGRLGQLGLMLSTYGNLPRPELWLPLVFTSPEEARESGLAN